MGSSQGRLGLRVKGNGWCMYVITFENLPKMKKNKLVGKKNFPRFKLTYIFVVIILANK